MNCRLDYVLGIENNGVTKTLKSNLILLCARAESMLNEV